VDLTTVPNVDLGHLS